MDTAASLQCGGRELDLSRPRVMGVLNVTPDSFYDGGFYLAPDSALNQAEAMIAAGADIIDIGGESTRPGAAEVSVQVELDRVLPVVESLAANLDVIVSVDTSTPEVMAAAAQAGAGLINDVRALSRPGALAAAEVSGLPVCLMHMSGTPRSMQNNPQYDDVVAEVYGYLQTRIDQCERAGISRQRLLLDPGFGFGKSLQHNLLLLKHLSLFTELGVPLLIGLSRKSMIGALLHKPVEQRLYGSLAAAVLAVQQGAAIVRVHDVAATVDALTVVQAVRELG